MQIKTEIPIQIQRQVLQTNVATWLSGVNGLAQCTTNTNSSLNTNTFWYIRKLLGSTRGHSWLAASNVRCETVKAAAPTSDCIAFQWLDGPISTKIHLEIQTQIQVQMQIQIQMQMQISNQMEICTKNNDASNSALPCSDVLNTNTTDRCTIHNCKYKCKYAMKHTQI